MEKNTNIEGNQLLQTRRNHRRWTMLVVLLAVLVSSGTFLVLRHNAIAATYKKRVLDCQQISGTVAHIHNDDCYDKNGLVCPLEEIAPHLHTSECYERELVCGLEESAGHVHTEECWAEETNLVCGLDEHVHGPECYELTLICGEDEALPEYDEAGEMVDPGHVHTDACYGYELICEEEEHVHSENCYETSRYTVCGMEEGEGAHQHDESCYVSNLICGQEELPVHIHDANCFITVDLTPEEVEAMRAAEEAAEEEARTEEAQEPAVGEATADEERGAAETAEGESEESKEPTDKTTDDAETDKPVDEEPAEVAIDTENYPAQHFEGEAAGLLVTVNAPAGAFPKGTEMVVSPIEDENVLNAATAEVQGEVVLVQGVDISFYDADGNEIEPLLPIQVEMVPSVESAPIIPDMTEVSNEQTLVHVDNELAATVMDQEDNTAPEVRFESDSFSAYIVVYTRIEKTVLASDGNNYRITVTCDPASGVPEDADLSVTEIPLDSELYETYRTMAEAALEGGQGVSFARFFDIEIRKDDVKIEPQAPVKVTISLADAPAETAPEELKVLHFAEDGVETVDEAQAAQKENETVELTFSAESFSVYGVITVPAPTGADNLGGRTLTISRGGRYLLTETGDIGNGGDHATGFKKGSESEAPVWQLEQVSGSTYYVYTIVNNQKKYMHMEVLNGTNRANASLSDNPQLFTVTQANGEYRLYTTINNQNYYLDEHNGVNGNGFAGWYGQTDNGKLSFNFTQPVLESNQEYMVVVKQGDSYYTVLNDGTLSPAVYNPENNTVAVENPMLWKYDGERLYHVTREAGFTDDDIASDSYYRYIDPNSASGLNEDNETNTTATVNDREVHINTRQLWNSVRFTYTSDHKLQSKTNSNYYIGVNNQGQLSLKGQVSAGEAVEIFLADPLVEASDWHKHTVNHIDISINGTAEVDVPLAYGKYYDEHGNVIKEVPQNKFEKLHLTRAQVVDPNELTITPEDMKRSSISASCNGVSLDNAFYITGYSGNAEHAEHGGDGNDYVTSPQVRIEGSFLVAKMPTEHATVDMSKYDSDQAYRNTIRSEHLANSVEYSVSVVKSVQFYLQMPIDDGSGNTVYQQLYDANGNPLKIRADLAFSDSFNYWDAENECPVFVDTDRWYYYKNYKPGWPNQLNEWNGDSLEAGDVARCGFSGMDFKLGGSGSQSAARVYAIEITKIVVDEQGNRIKSDNIGTADFSIYRKSVNTTQEVTGSDGNQYLDVVSADSDEVKDLNIGSFSSDEAYAAGYSFLRDKTIQVGSEGIGLVYDYDVTPALYYVEEDPESVKGIITDSSGKEWEYKETYIWTEYAWRNCSSDNFMHVGQTYTAKPEEGGYKSVPEILGNHYGYNGTDGPYTNDFLEFYVYNVYESPKVNVPVIKTWADFTGDEYDWTASFKLQWAPLYPGETKPSVSFQDVTPVKTMTITKADMDGITQELISRYLAGDSTLTVDEISKIEAITFKDLPKYGTDANGNTFRYQYSLEETAYRVINATTGVMLYSWDEENGYSGPDEDGHYMPFYPHDAGEVISGQSAEQNEADTNYYVDVRNQKKNVNIKEFIDVSLDKQWDINADGTSDTRDETYWAEFELRRFIHTEYRDLSHMSDADMTAGPITVTIQNSSGTVIDTLQVQPNVGLYLGGNFKPHDSGKSVTFTANHPVRLPNDSRVSAITAVAGGSNMSNAMVRTTEFFVTQDTVFTISEGAENLVTGNLAKVLDTGVGTPPLPDRSFSQTIRLDNTNTWHVDLNDLLRSQTSEGDDDDHENVTFYEYYLVEKDSNPKGYAQYFRADNNGAITTVLSGDSDHQIEHNDKIIALNGPSNRLIVKKLWRGAPITTGFPGITFTLYQSKDQNGNDKQVFTDENGTKYEHIELKGNNLEWVCPVTLPTTYTTSDGVSHNYYYYVQEDQRSGSYTGGEGSNAITAAWEYYYYLSTHQDENGNEITHQTNAYNQGNQVALIGSDVNRSGGTITICNKMTQYTDLDIKKQFFTLLPAGSWLNSTSDITKDVVLGFKVIRAIKTPDGKYLDEQGHEVNQPVWMDYSDEMLCGYDSNGQPVLDNGGNEYYLKYMGLWHFEIMNNWGDQTNIHAADSGSSLPTYGFYIRNGEDIVVEYEYSFRETNVYKNLARDPYPEWDWFSSITPVNGYGPGKTAFVAFPKVFHGQDPERIANFQASDLIIDKEWIGDPAASAVYVKIWRTSGNGAPEDFTAIIAKDVRNNHNWQMYLSDPSGIDLYRNCLILKPNSEGKWENSIKVSRALLGALAETGKYHYYIQEVGYRTVSGEYRTDVNGKFKPLYDKWLHDKNAWTGAPVGMNAFAENNIQIGAKGENRLKVTNQATPSTGYTVTKSFHGPQSSTSGQSTVTGKYPSDGSKQVVVQLQQRYRYEKTVGDVTYILKKDTANPQEAFARINMSGWDPDTDNEWIPETDPEADSQWLVDWQAAESAIPGSIALPLDKPAGSVFSDEEWYGSAAAWTYTWEGLNLVKTLANDSDPTKTSTAQLYYRAVEVSTPGWFNSVIAEEDQDGHKAVDDTLQVTPETNITNERNDCDLELNKEWTGLGKDDEGQPKTWPDGYVVYYQLIQHYHLANVNLSGETPVYSYGDTIKSVGMQKNNSSGDLTADNVHPQATGTLEKENHNLELTGLPMYGFFTATEEDVAAAAEHGITLTAGTVYPVVYTYSAKETAVKKNGDDVDFAEQTVAFTEKTSSAEQESGEQQPSGEEPEPDNQTETTASTAVYEATLMNEMTSVDVTKTWANNTPYTDSVTVKLYRVEEAPADDSCEITIKLSFGSNYDQINSDTITASVDGTQVVLSRSGNTDLWTGTVKLEKNSTPTISFTAPATNEGYRVTLNSQQITVPDADSGEVEVHGSVSIAQTGRTITVNVDWTKGGNPGAWSNLWYSGWTNTGISASTTTSGNTQTFVWNGVPTTGNNLFVQLGYNNIETLNNFSIQVIGSGYRINENNQLILGDIPAGASDVTINVSIGEKENTSSGSATIKLINNSGFGIWINSLQNNGEHGKFGNGWLNDGASDTINGLAAGEYTVQIGTGENDGGILSSQITGAESVDQWGEPGNNKGNVNIHINLADGESRTITVNARARQRTLSFKAPMFQAAAVAPSSETVNLEHAGVDSSLTICGNETYPVFTQDNLVDTQTLTAANNWHYEWTGLPSHNPESGAEYHYYVVEEIPESTKTVTYDRTEDETSGSTTVTINNEPVVNPQYGRITVTKRVLKTGTEDTALDISREFTIRLKQGEKFLKYTDSSHYEWVDDQASATAWTFNNGGSVTFTGLELGSYTIVEDTGTGMVEIAGYQFDSEGSTTSATVTITDENLENNAEIKNYYELSVPIDIVKVDSANRTKKLTGAKFLMTRSNGSTYVTFENEAFALDQNTEKHTGPFMITEEDGITIENLIPGTYEVREIEPPTGYVISNNTFHFTIEDDGTVSYTEGDNGLVWFKNRDNDNNANAEFEVGNPPGTALPQTGGIGTTLFTALGGLMTAMAGTILTLRRKKLHA